MNLSRIQPLPLHLANQIAAGEVVERPASVVKELVENSIDAGATAIEVTIEAAGRQLIKVTDNGSGIHPDDLPLALSRHATSKLNSTEQLSQIASLGFRGEALPSISSVSQLIIHSRQADQDCGWQISIDSSPAPSAHPTGTTVEVRDLFFNIPARRRFLRSDKTEQQHITATLNRLALSRFDVAFKWQIDNAGPVRLPAAQTQQQQLQRIGKICGQTFVRDALYLEQHYDEIALNGWISPPSAHRAQTDVQYFFINGRVIKDRVISHAIRQAYDALLPEGRQPGYVLYLTLPLDKVDVNVHPTKHEVRFREARLIHGLITKALQETLTESPPPHQTINKVDSRDISEPDPDYQAVSASPQTRPAVKHDSAALQLSGLIHQRYALVNIASDPAVIDLQLADRMLRQNAFIQAVEQQTLASRPVLVPIELPCSVAGIAVIKQHQATLSQLAFNLIPGQQGVIIKTIPSLLAQTDLRLLLEHIIAQLENTPSDLLSLASAIAKKLPLAPVQSTEHAQQILQQLTAFQPYCSSYYLKLDPETLAGLFSG